MFAGSPADRGGAKISSVTKGELTCPACGRSIGADAIRPRFQVLELKNQVENWQREARAMACLQALSPAPLLPKIPPKNRSRRGPSRHDWGS